VHVVAEATETGKKEALEDTKENKLKYSLTKKTHLAAVN